MILMEITKDSVFNAIKKLRNELLLQTDKFLIEDYPINKENLDIAIQYRIDLRNYININNDNLNNYIYNDLPQPNMFIKKNITIYTSLKDMFPSETIVDGIKLIIL